MFHVLKIILGGTAALLGIGWLGFQVKPKRFPPLAQPTRDCGSVPLPEDLPAPVRRFAEALYGNRLPILESAVITGWAELTLGGLHLPARFRFYQLAGSSYYHQIEVTWFGRAILSVHERYHNGQAILAIPGNHVENDANTNAAARQGLWGEAIWLPSILFMDRRVRWEAIDEDSAWLILPGAADEEHFRVDFDPETALITQISTRRYRDPAPAGRLRWTNNALLWGELNGFTTLLHSQTQWEDTPPWAVWHVEDISYNVDVAARFEYFGKK